MANNLAWTGNSLGVAAGYSIQLTASSTEWSNFYAAPSTRITSGTGLSWSGNTLNASNAFTGSGTNGQSAYWTSATGNFRFFTLNNGTVVGVNATSSTVNLLVQGTGSNIPFQVNTSTGTSLLTILGNGNVGIGTTGPEGKLTGSSIGSGVNVNSMSGYDLGLHHGKSQNFKY